MERKRDSSKSWQSTSKSHSCGMLARTRSYAVIRSSCLLTPPSSHCGYIDGIALVPDVRQLMSDFDAKKVLIFFFYGVTFVSGLNRRRLFLQRKVNVNENTARKQRSERIYLHVVSRHQEWHTNSEHLVSRHTGYPVYPPTNDARTRALPLSGFCSDRKTHIVMK